MNTIYRMGTDCLMQCRQYTDPMFSDACLLNLMMEESRVVPKGSHFKFSSSHDGVNLNLTWQHRCTVAPVRYFYIDFGLSRWHPHGHESAKALGVVGQLKDIPELSATVPYNPFKLDICQLGRTILEVIEVSDQFIVVSFAYSSRTGIPRSAYIYSIHRTHDTAKPKRSSQCD
jgi:hypothetical protein